MNTDTTIAKNIRVSDEKASYDAACKRLLSEKIILAWIMKNCVEEYRDCDVNEIAEQYIEGQPQVGETAVAPDETNRATRIHGIGVDEQGIQAMIAALKKLQIPPETILAEICEKFGLTKAEAEKI